MYSNTATLQPTHQILNVSLRHGVANQLLKVLSSKRRIRITKVVRVNRLPRDVGDILVGEDGLVAALVAGDAEVVMSDDFILVRNEWVVAVSGHAVVAGLVSAVAAVR